MWVILTIISLRWRILSKILAIISKESRPGYLTSSLLDFLDLIVNLVFRTPSLTTHYTRSRAPKPPTGRDDWVANMNSGRGLEVRPVHLDYDYDVPNHWSFWVCMAFNFLTVTSLLTYFYLRNTQVHLFIHNKNDHLSLVLPLDMNLDPSNSQSSSENAHNKLHGHATPESFPPQNANRDFGGGDFSENSGMANPKRSAPY